MQELSPSRRPYRSHLMPACTACRRRKSRCKAEQGSTACLMCRAHGTRCDFPATHQESHSNQPTPRPHRVQKRSKRTSTASQERVESRAAPPPHATRTPQQPVRHGSAWNNRWQGQRGSHNPTPLSADDAEQETRHIVGPANTTDSQMLTDYLACMGDSNGGTRILRTMPASSSKPVLFATVRKRPVGMDVRFNPSQEKLQIIEKLLEPCAERIPELYFLKTNMCLPLLDVQSFKAQYREAKDKISPALLACLYANSMVHWRYSPELARHRQPDNRFIWNLANEALYSELYLFPGISTITAVLLNIGGRPITSMIGNGVQLGAAVSLAHSLGLNRNPLQWDIPDAEKLQRMKIWWSLLVHDKWSSLAYGTPPHIRKSQCDVPGPSISLLTNGSSSTDAEVKAASVFVAFSGLTAVLDSYLQLLYEVDEDESDQHNPSGRGLPTAELEYKLNEWIETLEDQDVRRVITRGTNLDMPGAANLRLSYLSVQLLLRRLELEQHRGSTTVTGRVDALSNRYTGVRRTAEEMVVFTQELGDYQLGDFWLPLGAFMFHSATTCLLRCALEMEHDQAGLSRNSSLRLAWDLLVVLRSLKERKDWDMGDICLAQYETIVEGLMTPAVETTASTTAAAVVSDWQGMGIPDVSLVDELFPGLWETFPITGS